MLGVKSFRLQQHKDLYKSARERIPHWKEKLRTQYVKGTRSSRMKLLDKFRNCSPPDSDCPSLDDSKIDHQQLALSILEEEWEGELSLAHQMRHGSSEEQEVLLAILEEVQAEMKTFSEQLAEEMAQLEQADMEHLVRHFDQHEVICPVCQVNALHSGSPMNRSLGCSQTCVSCPCGLRLEGATLSSVQANLESTLDLHNAECQHPLSFAATSAPPVAESDMRSVACSPASKRLLTSNVLITCAACEWMSFLL